MYLKKLEIKGFKSFADKVSIKLEPGISSIVGPNGSGKSNICDAILWVLGERNAKQLRGNVMEDVIFAGSSSRNPVSMAEVTLVLDNTDNTLPIDYSEVSISRRIYKSGESEYLVNGIAVRRLDVLDILHDSGIGTDTNSIISQGHLDSILQSKASDRRTLIEEAAGVLKHKQRKMRSFRKLEHMSINMQRIYDVMSEIERQLKPLRIKAKRAKAYGGLVEKLNDYTLKINVDDLKNIQSIWNNVKYKKEQIENVVSENKQELENKEKLLDSLRSKLKNYSSDIVEYSNKQRLLNSYIDKLNSYCMILDEKARNSQEKFNTLQNLNVNNVNTERENLVNEKTSISKNLDDLNNQQLSLQNKLEESNNLLKNSLHNLNDKQTEYDKLQGKINSLKNDASIYTKKIEDASDSIMQAQAKTEKLKIEILSLEENIKNQENEISDEQKNINLYKSNLDSTNKKLEDINKDISQIVSKNNGISEEKNQLETKYTEIKANILATERLIQNSLDSASDANKWMQNSINKYSSVKALSNYIDVPDEYIGIVEKLLSSYSSGYIFNNKDIPSIKKDFIDSSKNGNLYLIENDNLENSKSLFSEISNFANKYCGTTLFDKIKYLDNNKCISLLCKVVIFDSFSDALKAACNTQLYCCASLDGSIIYPDGKYLFWNLNINDKDNVSQGISILSYKKKLKKLKLEKEKINSKIDKLNLKLEEVNAKYDNLNSAKNEINNELSELSIKYNFSEKLIKDKTAILNSYKEKLNTALENRKIQKEAYSLNAPQLQQYKTSLNDVNNKIKDCDNLLQNYLAELKNLRSAYEKNKEVYNSNVLDNAKVNERIRSLKLNLKNAIIRLQEYDDKQLKNLKDKEISIQIVKQCNIFSSILMSISNLAAKDLKIVNNNFSTINSDINSLQTKIDTTSRECMDIRANFDNNNSKLSDIKIELGKLEVKVQNAVDSIDAIEGISVDDALKFPDLENREELEEQVFKIRKRIANMGVINPDAVEEYENLKERYDFFNGQVEDLQSAKKSLLKIDKIIDEKMKDDFINTFDEVNCNFQEIFSILFPGGKAKLELEDEDDLENSGVEVKAQPHGKRINKMSLMSGGEKSLVALCLLFAVYKKRSTPFYILDEVEAALDDTNLRRLVKYIENLSRDTQLIMITHQRRTMEMSDVLYGVSMKNDGVTRVVSQKLDKSN